MLYRVEIRKKDGSVKYYGLQQGKVNVEATWFGGFKTAYDVFRCVEAEFREDPTVNYALPFADPDEKVDTLQKKGFVLVSNPAFDGRINPVLNPGKASVIIYCEDTTVKSPKSPTDTYVISTLAFDEKAFAATWEIARKTPRTPILKSLLLNPSTWYTSATLAVVIGTIISIVNPEAFLQALPYLAIAAPVFVGTGVLMLLVSTIYAIVCEKNKPDQPNPVINYLRERAEWIRQNPVKSGLILGLGSVVLLAAIVLTVGYFTHGFGIFPVNSFEFMHVVFDCITKLFAAGIDYLSALTDIGVGIPAASVTSFALTAAAVAFVTSIFWIFDTALRLAHTATDLTMPPRIKPPEPVKPETQKKNPDDREQIPPPANPANPNPLKPELPAPAPTHRMPAPLDLQVQTTGEIQNPMPGVTLIPVEKGGSEPQPQLKLEVTGDLSSPVFREPQAFNSAGTELHSPAPYSQFSAVPATNSLVTEEPPAQPFKPDEQSGDGTPDNPFYRLWASDPNPVKTLAQHYNTSGNFDSSEEDPDLVDLLSKHDLNK